MYLESAVEEHNVDGIDFTPLLQEKRAPRPRQVIPREKDVQRRCLVACLVTVILLGVGVFVFVMAIR